MQWLRNTVCCAIHTCELKPCSSLGHNSFKMGWAKIGSCSVFCVGNFDMWTETINKYSHLQTRHWRGYEKLSFKDLNDHYKFNMSVHVCLTLLNISFQLPQQLFLLKGNPGLIIIFIMITIGHLCQNSYYYILNISIIWLFTFYVF